MSAATEGSPAPDPGATLGLRAIDSGDAPATQVGRYRIVGKLGEGAMAMVYKAYDPSIERPLVVKFLHHHLAADPEQRGRFLREARAAGNLAHPNIVTVFDVGEIEGRPYIAMELLEGGALDARLSKGERMPVREATDLALQIARALDYAHQRGVFHRDVKPGNIVSVGDGRTVKITDFGIAHLGSAHAAERTTVGTLIGTPNYMSPEQAMGEQVDGRSDMFSLGVMLYQMLAGRRPFEGDTLVTLMMRLAREEPEPIEKLRDDVPPALKRIVERCLQKQPGRRYANCGELAAALEKVRDEIDAQTTRSGRTRRVPLKVRLALGMAALVVVTMALTATYVSQRQYRTMMLQSVGHGASIAKLIAAESSASALSEDWVGIDVLVQELARTLSLRTLTVADTQSVVRVSNDAALVSKPQPASAGEPVDTGTELGVKVRRLADVDRIPVFGFEAPITFQDKRVGTVFLAISEAPLVAASRETLMLMALLLVVTAAAVGVATYVLVDRYAKPLALLRESFEQIGPGRQGYRIAELRNDEFGDVYRAFDAMAERIDAANAASDVAPAARPPAPGAADGARAHADANATVVAPRGTAGSGGTLAPPAGAAAAADADATLVAAPRSAAGAPPPASPGTASPRPRA
ncbi:MAG: protein kinase [Burkholderiaceae bacterium]